VKLVDTSAWIEFLRGTKSPTDSRVQALLNSRDAAWCEVIVLELLNGASAGEVRRIERLRREVWHFEIDARVWSVALNLAVAARNSAITAPTVDVVVAACARVYDLRIEHHRDAHFEDLAKVSI
jgi:predicted nucleic acid-binding protein